jgi:hypothetical protein
MQEENIARLNFTKSRLVSFLMFANEHNGDYPTNFDQLESYFSKNAKEPEGLTADQFEIVYQGPEKGITNLMNTVVLREKEARQAPDGRWQKAYGFADGHGEIHTEKDGNFDAYERAHIITRPAQ